MGSTKALAVVAAMLASLILSAAAAAVALATPGPECKETSGLPAQLCVEQAGILELVKAEEVVLLEGSKEPETKWKILVTEGPEIVCGTAPSNGSFEGQATGVAIRNLVIDFLGCAVENAKTTCEIEGQMEKTSMLSGAFLSAEDVVFAPESGTVFLTYTIKSIAGKTCVLAVKNATVTGSQLCLVALPLTAQLIKLLVCTPEGSDLREFEKLATMELTEELFLTKEAAEKAWSVEEDE